MLAIGVELQVGAMAIEQLPELGSTLWGLGEDALLAAWPSRRPAHQKWVGMAGAKAIARQDFIREVI